MTPEEKAKAYDKALERANDILKGYNPKEGSKATINYIFPELQEGGDERIKNRIIQAIKIREKEMNEEWSDEIAWLEKQGDNLVEKGYTNNKDVIKYAGNYSRAIWHKLMDNFKNIKDYHIGCNDVSDIVLNAIIDTYNWLEKQGEKEFTFKSIPRLLEMIEPTDRAKSYCQKLIDSLIKEGYVIDAMIVGECLKQMNGEDVPMAVMDKQKPADKVESKFKVGDWIISKTSNLVYHVDSILCKRYYLSHNGGIVIVNFADEQNYRLWTIQDAKDGDILADDYGIYIFDRFDEYDERCFLCMGAYQYSQKVFENRHMLCSVEVHPVTKEQCDLLFQKMKESGYEWDAEKKELKKIDNKSLDEFAGLTDFEKTLADICIGWIGEEPGWKQYIKDNADVLLRIAVEKFNSVQDTPFGKSIYQSIMDDTVQENQLDSEQINWLKFTSRVQPKIGWTKEDEKRFKSCLNILQPKTLLGNIETINTKWFKSLKQRYTWKPSDGQMEALKEACDKSWEPDGLDPLYTLYQDLEKLKGE